MRMNSIAAHCFCATALLPAGMLAQSQPSTPHGAELRLHIVSSMPEVQRDVPAVIWLEPLEGTPALPFVAHGHYTLLQKDRTFIPHLQVIPVGSVVQFPNADPFFHNVFSLFDGRKFDLGLYEAGSSKSVTFPREGVSYIFCNIHPEMSAVVLSLSTPLYAIAEKGNSFDLRDIPPGSYKLHFWIEGVPQSVLPGLTRHLQVETGLIDLGNVKVPIARRAEQKHENKFGASYDRNLDPNY
jgi:hypothetical protein